jgi:transcriptional regulator with XRE-family HTH domain
VTPAELRQWRESHGLSLRAAGRALGVAPSTLLRWESGERGMRWPDAVRGRMERYERELAAREA